MRIGLMGAMPEEIEQLKYVGKLQYQHRIQHFVFYEILYQNKTLFIVKSGVGKVLSSLVAQLLIIHFNVEKIIFSGVAGALDPSLQIGDMIVANKVMQYDMDATGLGFEMGQIPYSDYKYFYPDKYLVSLTLHSATDHLIHEGFIISGDVFMTKKNANHYAHIHALNAQAIDMESASVGLVCSIYNIPFLVIRTISDTADHNAEISFNAMLPIIIHQNTKVVQEVLSKL